MKTAAISRFVIMGAIAALVAVCGSTPLLAQACPASPSFSPDFTSGHSCMTLNGASTGNPIFAPVITPPMPNDPPVATVLRLTDSTSNRVGSAWFNTAQQVQNGFSTSFQFEFSNPSGTPADGIAFVIQNVPTLPLNAIGFTGGNGGAIGYGNDDGNSTQSGITNSVAIEFDTYQNPVWDPLPNTNGVSHVAIQSCGAGPNTSHHFQNCSNSQVSSTVGAPVSVPALANGLPHNVTITYTPACSTCASVTPANIHVILDGTDLYPTGVAVDLSSITLTSGAAYVGFTAATGGSFETQDILNWTFTSQQKSTVIAAGAQTPTPLIFSGGPNTPTNGFEYDLQLDANGDNGNDNPATVTGSVTTIPITQSACNKLVQKNFPLTQCFVFQNADGKGHSGAVLFELTCPNFDGTASSNCGDTSLNNFAAGLGTSFNFLKSQNFGFQLLNSTIGPYPGWLKGDGGTAGHPCIAPTTGALFQSNQITSFSVVGDPLGTTKGKSGGGGSCWVATFATFGELPPRVQLTIPQTPPAKIPTYTKNQVVTASYSCSTPITSKDPTVSSVGPYLTVDSCKQSSGTQTSCTTSSSGMTCSGTIDTSHSSNLPQVFTVTSKDTGGNVGANLAIYNVH